MLKSGSDGAEPQLERFYRGNAFVPNQSGSYGQFDAEYFFARQRGPVASEKYSPGTDKDLFISHEVGVSAVVWTPCGASTNFRQCDHCGEESGRKERHADLP
ncbi:hypothetical protein PI124_g17911 [Phytophthora idaei]|nr:hypothetical protein PI125_g18641 [Phytophthora idaei]KAG3237088.1 hypothetical protein PI124_g17911 [Phytophthora idaei]